MLGVLDGDEAAVGGARGRGGGVVREPGLVVSQLFLKASHLGLETLLGLSEHKEIFVTLLNCLRTLLLQWRGG